MTFAEVESGFSNLYFEGNNFENELNGEDAREDHVQVVERVGVMSALTLVLQTTDHTYTHTLSFYGPISGTIRVSRWQKKSSSGFYSARRDTRYTDNPAGCHSIRTNQRSTSLIPHFYTGCPSCCNPHTSSWLGTDTKYAGLHTQWIGSDIQSTCSNFHKQ